MPFVSVNGLNTFYESRGKGRTLILVHGAGGTSQYWGLQLSELSKRLRVIAIDLPGHGKSERLKEKATTEMYADHLAGFMKQIKLDHAIIAGHSLGGLIVQQLALKRPELFEKLIIVDSAARFPDPTRVSNQSGGSEALRNFFLNQPPEVLSRAIISRLFSKKTIEKGGLSPILKYLPTDSVYDPSIWLNDFEAGRGVDLREKIKEINIPTLIIAGADSLIPISMAQLLHENIKGSVLEIIPDAGHMLMLEKPDQFNQAVLRFVGE
ncbi:MAG: alpha/beta hydrolase [Candidatus Jordarchaeaceae archaeon]